MRRVLLIWSIMIGLVSMPTLFGYTVMAEASAMAERQPNILGVVDGALAPMPSSPNAVSSQTPDTGKRVASLPMRGTMAQTRQHILDCLQQMGRNDVKTAQEHYIYTVFVSSIFRFKDDVEFFIDENAQVVHFRSASRVGYSDLGTNRKRYEAFKALYLQ